MVRGNDGGCALRDRGIPNWYIEREEGIRQPLLYPASFSPEVYKCLVVPSARNLVG